MELRFINPGFDYMCDRIMFFQGDETSSFWSSPLYYFYPQLNKEYAYSLETKDRKSYIEQVLRNVYLEQESAIDEKIALYSKQWEACKPQITEALSDAFGIDCSSLFNDMTCNISMNPIEPRYLETHSFDVFYLNSEKGAIGEAIHEIIHFVWFYVWQRIFHDDPADYETPHLKWLLSEMAVEPIMRDERLGSINPYYTHKGCVYSYFYTMEIEGKPILDTLYAMFSSMQISEFMRESYDYCIKHEAAIRKHIQSSETA